MYNVRICSRHPSHRTLELPKFSKRIRVRFGSQIPHRRMDIDFNSIPAIARTANKKAMKDVFLEHGINTPKFLQNTAGARVMIADGHLGDNIFFKTTFHSRGRGMLVFTNRDEAIKTHTAGYFEETQEGKREFRVHVMDGKMFHIDEKRTRERGTESLIKNMENGYKFRRPLRDYPDEVISESIKAVNALGLDFGAADVGVNENGVWIYEVNTAPSFRTKTRKAYQVALVELINKKISEL